MIIIAFFFPKEYVTYPGYGSDENYQKFLLTKKSCIGFSKDRIAMTADDVQESICFGWLK